MKATQAAGSGALTRPPRRRAAVRLVHAALLLAGLGGRLPARAQDAPGSAARGEALFEGREPVAGRIRDHARDLPPAVVVCANCHAQQQGTQPLPNQAPVLNRLALLTPASRRNGPISAYDQSTFCRVVRTGVDPRSIVLARAMPLFAIGPAQCASLWTYLTANTPS